jgi:plasmid stabilization system protein ParE
MKLRLTPQAARDLADIGDYLWERSPAVAWRVRDAIRHPARKPEHSDA